MEYEHYPTLEVIREVLEVEVQGFPEGCCQLSASIINTILGLPELAGVYLTPEENTEHSWNHDPLNKLYVDITLDQFLEVDSDITIVPEDNPLFFVEPGQLYYQRCYAEDPNQERQELLEIITKRLNLQKVLETV